MTGPQLMACRARVEAIAALVAPATSGVTPTTSGVATTTSGVATTTRSGTAFAAALAGALGATVTGAGDAETWPASVAGPSVAASATGPGLVEAARTYLGVPYVWGGESLAEGGLDCSGLVQRALADIGVTDVPRVARDQATLGTPVGSLAEALPGDLVVFEGGRHIGIYAGGGKMIDAPKPGEVVQLRDVYETPTTIRRVLPQQEATPSAWWSGAAGVPAALPSGTDLALVQRAVYEAVLAQVAA